ncbi:MAG TPA: FAD-binding oxidoreductase, partial [Jiangellaceae bacterium]
MSGNASELIDKLGVIVGPSHVLTDPELTDGYVADWTGRWRGRTAAVVRPGSTDEVAAVVAACGAAGVAIVPQGGNTGLVGASVPHNGEVVLSTRRLVGVEVDLVGRTLSAGAGVTLADAQRAAASAGLVLGIDLGARESATLGGVVATNAGGLRVVRYGSTRSQVAGVEAVLADGSVLRRWTGLVKDNVGYDLPGLLTGSEGTLAVITRVLFRLADPPADVTTVLAGVPTLAAAHDVVARLRHHDYPIEAAEYFYNEGLELVCAQLGLRRPFAAAYPVYVLCEVSGRDVESVAETLASMPDLVADATLDAAPAERLWAYRESHPEAVNAAAAERGVAPVRVDVAVPLGRHVDLEDAVRDAVTARFPGVEVVTFGHLAEGNSHTTLLGVPLEDADEATEIVLRLVAERGGSISAEHGVGLAKRQWLGLQRSDVDVATMRAIKQALDPRGVLSPSTLLP